MVHLVIEIPFEEHFDLNFVTDSLRKRSNSIVKVSLFVSLSESGQALTSCATFREIHHSIQNGLRSELLLKGNQ